MIDDSLFDPKAKAFDVGGQLAENRYNTCLLTPMSTVLSDNSNLLPTAKRFLSELLPDSALQTVSIARCGHDRPAMNRGRDKNPCLDGCHLHRCSGMGPIWHPWTLVSAHLHDTPPWMDT